MFFFEFENPFSLHDITFKLFPVAALPQTLQTSSFDFSISIFVVLIESISIFVVFLASELFAREKYDGILISSVHTSFSYLVVDSLVGKTLTFSRKG